jgi:hypothetical protein
MLDQSCMFGQSIQQTLAVGPKKKKKTFKNTDHFCGEMKYFSDCILNGTEPEPEEGYADVRVLDGILAALKSGGAGRGSCHPSRGPSASTRRRKRWNFVAVSTPDLVDESNPGKRVDKQAEN